MNRPPTPFEICPDEYFAAAAVSNEWVKNEPCMQDALTAEWLIEYGFMPDPTEYYMLKVNGGRMTIQWLDKWSAWTCEDKTR